MLYDTRWDKPARLDPLSVESLIAWLEKKPARGRYYWTFAATCLIGQYFQEMGFGDYEAKSAFLGRYNTKFGQIAGIGGRWPWDTYGSALKRAREMT